MPRIGGRPPGYKPNGPEIRRLRKMVHGLSAAELGARAGLTEDVVWKAERSLPVMDITAVRLAKALGVDVEDIASPPGDDTRSDAEKISALDAKNGPAAANDRASERDTSRSTG